MTPYTLHHWPDVTPEDEAEVLRLLREFDADAVAVWVDRPHLRLVVAS